MGNGRKPTASAEADAGKRSGLRFDLQLHDVGGGGAFVALFDFELNLLALGQRLESVHPDGGKVDEYIASVFFFNEAEPLFVVKPLYDTLH